MTRKERYALGRAFAHEVAGRKYQPRRTDTIDALIDGGMLVEVERTLGARFPVTFKWLELTHAGRIAYCSTCRGERGKP